MSKKILNIGCGSDIYGTHFLDKYPSRKEVIRCDFDEEKLPFPNNYFDEVYCKNVFEHVTNLGFIFGEIHRILKKNGKLVLITDNANYWRWAVGKFHFGGYEKSRTKENIKEDRHFALFTTWHLENFGRKFGFRKIKTQYLRSEYESTTLTPKNLLVRLINSFLSKGPFYRMAYDRVKIECIK